MSYLFTEEEEKCLYELENAWNNMTNQLCEFKFNLKNFQRVAVETFNYIAKFTGKDYPCEIVKLLLPIYAFSINDYCVGAESDAARLVAETFCDVEDFCGVTDVCCQEYTVFDDAKLEVCGPSKVHIIEPKTFDLAELISDIKDNWY